MCKITICGSRLRPCDMLSAVLISLLEDGHNSESVVSDWQSAFPLRLNPIF
jgi:hypothetical protein